MKGTLKMEVCYKADWTSSYYDVRPCAQILEKVGQFLITRMNLSNGTPKPIHFPFVPY